MIETKGFKARDTDPQEFDEAFFKVAERKKQELDRLCATPLPTLAEREKEEIRKIVEEFAAPLEAKAFEAGRLEGLAEAEGRSGNLSKDKTAIVEKAARLLGSATTKTAAKRDLSPVDLARDRAIRANELVAAAHAEGKELSQAAAVRLAYEEAGVPLR
jgi:hypothetical protein